ncbi:MAG: DUF4174 domain-containing protein [Verrucomicrobiales bacterium]|nr:DUF4174 domain-containing protein [Verrucomicrobiales bacterium]
MKALLITALVLMTISSVRGDTLSDLKGEKRVLLLDFPEGSGYNLSQLEKQIQRGKKNISDRDLVLLHIGDLGKTGRRYAEEISEEDRETIRTRFKLGERTDLPLIILIGKDGDIKAAQKKDFDLVKLFKLIDAMPMRKKESQEE